MFDGSTELCLTRRKNGIKLAPFFNSDYYNDSANNIKTVSQVLKSPLNVIFLDFRNITQHINESNAITLGYDSNSAAIGTTIFEVYQKRAAEFSTRHDIEVMKNEKKIIKEESCLRLDGTEFNCITAKIPLYNMDDKIIGLVGYSIPIELTKSIDMQNALLAFCRLTAIENISPLMEYTKKNNLSKREKEILYHYTKGKTAKLVAKFLNLSPRTVEQHLENIKHKMCASSKSELIAKAINEVEFHETAIT